MKHFRAPVQTTNIVQLEADHLYPAD